MNIDKDISKLSAEEYAVLLDISKALTHKMVELCVKNNTLTIQTAVFTYVLAGLVFFKNLGTDGDFIIKVIKDCLDGVNSKLSELENGNRGE